MKDLDLWAAGNVRSRIEEAIASIARSIVSRTAGTRWLQATVYTVSHRSELTLLDCTFGDLKVGALPYCDERFIQYGGQGIDRRVVGIAAVADQIVRPLMRGKPPHSKSVVEAQAQWRGVTKAGQQEWLASLESTVGSDLMDAVKRILETGEVADELPRAVQRRVRMASAGDSSVIRALWSRRRAFLPFKAGPTPLKRPVGGLLLRLEGPDAEFSYQCEAVVQGLHELGYPLATLFGDRGAGKENAPLKAGRSAPLQALSVSAMLSVLRRIWAGEIVLVESSGMTVREGGSVLNDGVAPWMRSVPQVVVQFDRTACEVAVAPAPWNRSSLVVRIPGEAREGHEVSECVAAAIEMVAHRWYIDDMRLAAQSVFAPPRFAGSATSSRSAHDV